VDNSYKCDFSQLGHTSSSRWWLAVMCLCYVLFVCRIFHYILYNFEYSASCICTLWIFSVLFCCRSDLVNINPFRFNNASVDCSKL
jgi:hypothetical protein